MNDLTSRLKKRVEIENPVETPDGGGGFTITWQNFATVWAEIIPFTASSRNSERSVNSKLEDVGSFRITIRHLDGVEAKMQVKFGTRLFNIRAVIDPNENKELLELIAEEGVAI